MQGVIVHLLIENVGRYDSLLPSLCRGGGVGHYGPYITHCAMLSEGTWWSSDSVMYFLGSSGAKD